MALTSENFDDLGLEGYVQVHFLAFFTMLDHVIVHVIVQAKSLERVALSLNDVKVC